VRQARDRRSEYEYDRRVPPRRLTLESYDTDATQGGAYANLRWQATAASLVTAGARVDAGSAMPGATASPWVQFEQRLPRGFQLRAGSGVYRQDPSSEQTSGVHGGGDALFSQQAWHADLGIEQILGGRTRWQVSLFNREERDVVFASGLEPRAPGSLVPYNPLARYENRLDGNARGIEAVLQRRDPNGLSGWVAYAYEQSRYTDPQTGESFDGDYDQRHTLNVYASVRLSARTTLVGKCRLGSNIPVRGYYTPTGAEDANGLPVFTPGTSRNEGRLPTYARLDVRLNQVFNFSTRRLTLFVELINVTNRTNGGLSGGRYVEKLLPFVPAAGFLVEF
jgi:outer membrane receptor for ferrienterochelin and colicin